MLCLGWKRLNRSWKLRVLFADPVLSQQAQFPVASCWSFQYTSCHIYSSVARDIIIIKETVHKKIQKKPSNIEKQFKTNKKQITPIEGWQKCNQWVITSATLYRTLSRQYLGRSCSSQQLSSLRHAVIHDGVARAYYISVKFMSWHFYRPCCFKTPFSWEILSH